MQKIPSGPGETQGHPDGPRSYLRTMSKKKPPRVGLSWGAPHGIGSECILKAFADERLFEDLLPVVYGHAETLRQQAGQFDVHIDIRDVEDAADAKPGALYCVDIAPALLEPDWGQPHPSAGEFARLSLEAAVKDLASTKVDVLVTAPINKDTIQSGQFKFPGHTEYLADKAGVDDVLMVLASDSLRVGVVTGHVALKDVASTLSKERIVKYGTLLHESLGRDFGVATPHIAVLGLNPHAGDMASSGRRRRPSSCPPCAPCRKLG